MRRFALVIIALALLVTACTSQGPKELYDNAQFEELQHNPGHAIELYNEIIRDYPDSEYAKLAKVRLAELSKGKNTK